MGSLYARIVCTLGAHHRQIGVARFGPELGQQTVHLAAMVRLMIEEMRDQKAGRPGYLPARST